MLRLRSVKQLPRACPPRLRAQLRESRVGRKFNRDWEALLAFQLAHAEPPLLPFERNYRFAKQLGRRFEADFAWPSDHLLVELQGGIWQRGKSGHTSGSGVSRDVMKAQCAAVLGYVLLPVTSDDVRSGRAVELIHGLLYHKGHDPQLLFAQSRNHMLFQHLTPNREGK